MTLLKDKTILITGGGSGVGRATALVCAREGALKAAGFVAVKIVDTGADLNAYVQMDTQSSCSAAASEDANHYARFAAVLRKYDVNPFIASVNVFALKPK